MTRTPLFLSTSAAALLLAQGALAEVSAADVWSNYQAYMGAFGAETSAELSVAGDTTTVSGTTARFGLPFGLGAITMTSSDWRMTEMADGTVTVTYPSGTSVSVGLDAPGQITGALALELTGADLAMTASGAPGDVTYAYDIPEYGLKLTAFDLSGPLVDQDQTGMMAAVDPNFTATLTGNTGSMRVTEGELIEIALDGGYASMSYETTFELGGTMSGFDRGSVGATSSQAALALPPGGVSVMALPAALRDGLRADLSTSAKSTISNQELRLGDAVVSRSSDSTASVETTVTLDAGGLVTAGTLVGLAFEQIDQQIPLPIKGQLAEGDVRFAIPLLASDAQQALDVLIDLTGLELDAALWGLIDPAGALPRDPADLTIDLAAQVGTQIDLLDFPALMAVGQTGELPFSISALDVKALALSAVGAKLDGAGAFTVDMAGGGGVFAGLPAPTGKLDLSLEGANGLINTLIDAGMVQPDEAMGARMAIGFLAKPAADGSDRLTSEIEIDGPSGAVYANGQRIQ